MNYNELYLLCPIEITVPAVSFYSELWRILTCKLHLVFARSLFLIRIPGLLRRCDITFLTSWTPMYLILQRCTSLDWILDLTSVVITSLKPGHVVLCKSLYSQGHFKIIFVDISLEGIVGIVSYWFRWWIGADWQQAIAWVNTDQTIKIICFYQVLMS